jgi:hypothetical protein
MALRPQATSDRQRALPLVRCRSYNFITLTRLGCCRAGRAGSPLRGLGELGSPLGIFRNCTSLLLVLRDHLAGGSEHLYLAVA